MRTPRDVVGPVLALTFALASGPARADVPQVRESPAASVALDVGVTHLRVDYHRPGKKGRELWGKLVPYGKVWRAGANEATTVTFSDPVKVDGHDVPAGTYGLFLLPAEGKWTFILSKQAKIWGAFEYSDKEDVARVAVTPTSGPPVEWMHFDLTPTSDHGAVVELAWDTVRVAMPVEVDVPGIYKKVLLDAIAKADPKDPASTRTYLTAASYYTKENLDPAQALKWADTALSLKEGLWTLEAKGDALSKLGRGKEARPLYEKALKLAGEMPAEYTNKLKAKIAAAK